MCSLRKRDSLIFHRKSERSRNISDAFGERHCCLGPQCHATSREKKIRLVAELIGVSLSDSPLLTLRQHARLMMVVRVVYLAVTVTLTECPCVVTFDSLFCNVARPLPAARDAEDA